MNLEDNVGCVGHFSIKTFSDDGSVETYEDKNLIMNLARESMAMSIGGPTTGADKATPITEFRLGTRGHLGSDILDNVQVGADGADGTKFDADRAYMFSEKPGNVDYAYQMTFDPTGATDVTRVIGGKLMSNTTTSVTDSSGNSIQRVVSGRTITYTITIPAQNANPPQNDPKPVIAYTEACLIAGTKMFSMKTFPARVKENTVKFEITWSISLVRLLSAAIQQTTVRCLRYKKRPNSTILIYHLQTRC